MKTETPVIKKYVEVFRTNVDSAADAESILHLIHQLDEDYEANFDLEDCDNIFRIAYREQLNYEAIFQVFLCYGITISVL